MTTTLRIGSVPEHFNLPWHLCMENGSFKTKNINVVWKDFPGGTGAMTKALRNNEIDIAILLTEGIVKDITEGNPSKIIQTYIKSPLVWGIHVAASSNFQDIESLENASAAISRYGSGSHLMAYVNAKKQGWETKNLKFEVIKNLDGAIDGLKKGKGDYFMWEHFTTKPFVDNGTFRRIADCPTPWPCFVIAATNNALNSKLPEIKELLQTINQTTQTFKKINGIDELLAKKYNQKLADIKKWLSITEWSQQQLSHNTLDKVQEQLLELNIIDKKIKPDQILFDCN